jgi:hypothetical protein
LQAIVWGWTSFTWTYAQTYPAALRCIQQGRSLATQNRVVSAWLAAIEAEIQVHLGNSAACRQSLLEAEAGFGQTVSQEIAYLFEFHPLLILGYKGICLQQLYVKEKRETHHYLYEAQAALETALTKEVPLKRKLYYLSGLAGIFARKGEVEMACTSLIESVPLMAQVGTGSKTIRQHVRQVHQLLRAYKDTFSVQALDEHLAPLQIWEAQPDV